MDIREPVAVAFVGIGSLAVDLLTMASPYGPISPWHVIAAFDVDPKKVGRQLSEIAPFHRPGSIKGGGVPITAAPVLDSLTAPGASKIDCPAGAGQEATRGILRETAPEAVLFMAPPGEMVAAFWWQAAIHSTASIVNATTAKMAREPDIVARCHEAGVDCVGDEISRESPGPAARASYAIALFISRRHPLMAHSWWLGMQRSNFSRPSPPP